ncbi:hypothetical protein [Corynebacterium phoceense]|uniref:hypothetical protein n=1 Tax=Corynebacterium phoceense TaxID=1686286 RepID=UPI000839BF76|nr:hypothetical protein [Corynebacterium phoceense]
MEVDEDVDHPPRRGELRAVFYVLLQALVEAIVVAGFHAGQPVDVVHKPRFGGADDQSVAPVLGDADGGLVFGFGWGGVLRCDLV